MERKKLEELHYWLGHNLYSINVAERESSIFTFLLIETVQSSLQQGTQITLLTLNYQ